MKMLYAGYQFLPDYSQSSGPEKDMADRISVFTSFLKPE
jgi:hypothetical protein